MPELRAQFDAMDAAALVSVVRRALNRDTATAEDWASVPLTHGVINPVTPGLCQLSGTAREGEEQLPWSVILKAIRWFDLRGMPLASSTTG